MSKRRLHTRVLTASSPTAHRRNPRSARRGGTEDEHAGTCAVGCCLALERKGILPCAATGPDLEGILVKEGAVEGQVLNDPTPTELSEMVTAVEAARGVKGAWAGGGGDGSRSSPGAKFQSWCGGASSTVPLCDTVTVADGPVRELESASGG